MRLAECFKPVVAKAHQAVLVADHQPFDYPQFDVLNDPVKALAIPLSTGQGTGYLLSHASVGAI